MTDLAFMAAVQERRLADLVARGVHVIDPRQTYVDAGVLAERIHPGVVLHPGTRLIGQRTFLGPEAELGREGPVTAIDCVLGEGARIDGGYARDAVLLRGASAGSAAHLREGTLLEEEASTAHAVGLKHTILMSFVTVGSLVNFCDLLMAGGSSRKDHSEVGSGYIHFNFTPWGERGDKATPSLIGDVPRGALLRARRIFLGGSGGMVGPRVVGFGAVAGAGQVLRKDVPEDRMVIQLPRELERPFPYDAIDPPEPRAIHNARFIGELTALRAWYSEIRLRRAPETGPFEHVRTVTQEAIASIDLAIAERQIRFSAFLRERGVDAPALRPSRPHPCPLVLSPDSGSYTDHVEWVKGLPDADIAALSSWLAGIVRDVANS
ncbi:MAG TPA: UDP-N-acetylglucosamine pyrophosphorylase [Nannocystis sp.]|jgi:UDP-N-acetylglucosamine/UDP-N-acetylgalactosamine diphosphorylase